MHILYQSYCCLYYHNVCIFAFTDDVLDIKWVQYIHSIRPTSLRSTTYIKKFIFSYSIWLMFLSWGLSKNMNMQSYQIHKYQQGLSKLLKPKIFEYFMKAKFWKPESSSTNGYFCKKNPCIGNLSLIYTTWFGSFSQIT